MKIYCDEESALKLGVQMVSLAEVEVSIVQLELRNETSRYQQDCIGFKTVLEVAKEGAPVVMLGWMFPKNYIEIKPAEWFAAMGYPHVVLRAPCDVETPEELLMAIEEAKAAKRTPDPLAIALYGLKESNEAIRVLHHDLLGAERDEQRMTKWLQAARAVLGDKTKDELTSLVKSRPENRSAGPLAGQVFPDVCVDVEGTLIVDGHLRPEILAMAQEKANGGPITIWTGGSVHALTADLRREGVLHKIASKYDFRGATVGVVIDDQSEGVFQMEYGAGYTEYIRVD